jgi:hypothetical protein
MQEHGQESLVMSLKGKKKKKKKSERFLFNKLVIYRYGRLVRLDIPAPKNHNAKP